MVFSLGGNGGGSGSGITGLGSSLLSSWYNARLTNSALSTLNSAQSATQTSQTSTAQTTEILPPWDVRGDIATAEEKLRDALGGGKLVRIDGTSFDKEGVPEDHKTLFGLYNALDRLSAIAGHAADKSTSELLLSSLDRRFQEGLAEVKSFLEDTETEGFTLVAGDKTKRSDSSLTLERTLSQYYSGVVHRGSLSNAVSSLTGSEVFTVEITKGGVATDVTVDLSTITGDLTLDNVVSAFNDALETAGVITRMKRVEIEEDHTSDISQFLTEDDDDDDTSATAEKAYGLVIEGVSTEVVSMSASDAEAAVYLSGVSGREESEGGQLLKVKGIGGTAEIVVGTRIEAEEAQANAAASALDSEGNLYIVGNAQGLIDGLEVKGEQDVFLSKYNSAGELLYTRLLGSAETAEGFALAIDSDDNVVVAGQVTGELGSGVVGGGTDAFVTKYSSIGAEVFTRQISPLADDGALGITTGSDGSIYVTGYASSAVASGQTYSGKTDAVVTKLDSDGTLSYHRQFGTSGDDRAVATAIADDGDLLVASIEDGEAILRKFEVSSGTSAAIWEVNLGDLDGGQIGGIAVDGSKVYLAGSTSNAALDASGTATVLGSFGGASDGFLARIDDAGSSASANFTRYISTGSTDRATAITVSAGKVYVAGETQGELSGATQQGTSDGFALRFDEDGTQEWAYQYSGREGYAAARGISVDESGASSLDILGLPRGAISYSKPSDVTDRSSVRPDDYFYISVDGKPKKKITIDAGDSLRDISVKLNAVLLLDGSARVRRTGDGDTLRIEGELGVRIDILPGQGERDALKGLGLKAGTIYDDGSVLDEPAEEGEEDEELILGLGLLEDFSLATRSDATAVVTALEDALSAVRKAYREITKDPALEALLTQQRRTQGTVPDSLRRQLANYQAGLTRLQGGGSTITGLF